MPANTMGRMRTVYLGMIEELGGESCYVVSTNPDRAKQLLLKAWREYDRLHGSDYHGQVKTFENLADIYGAIVVQMPWDEIVRETQLESIL